MKNKFPILLLLSFMVAGLGTSLSTFKYDLLNAETPANLNKDFSYKYDYTKYEAYSTDWQSSVFETNHMTISPQSNSLGVGIPGETDEGQGYVIYKYEAPENKAFSYMEAHWIGRVFHNIEGGPCAAGECTCGMDVLVSTDNITYTVAGHENPSIAGTNEFGFKHDLTELARLNSVVYVKFLIDGKNWDWVNMTSLEVYGNYCNSQTNITSANAHNATNTRIKSGEEFTVDVDVRNNASGSFNGKVQVMAPGHYFESNSSSSITIDGNSSKSVSLKLNLKQAGYTNYFICLYDNLGNLYDRLPITTFARGKGAYRFDTHSHSFVSDGRNSFLDNYTQCHEKGLSGAISTDHDAPKPGDDSMAITATDELNKLIQEDFLAFRGSEISSAGNFHILSTNFSTEIARGTNSQTVINHVVNQGGFAYLAHPFLKGYTNADLGTDPTKVDALYGMTGLELYNAECSMIRGRERDFDDKNLEYWDRLNITGKRKFYGTSGSDAHDAIIIGAVSTVFLAEDLTKEEILKSYANGKSYITTGPELDFSIDGKTFGESIFVEGSKNSTIHIEAYDPDFPITKVVLYKFNVDPENNDLEFTNGRNNCQVLYEQGEDKIYDFVYDAPVTLSEDTFYRVEVFTEEGSLQWSRRDYAGFAYGNPIFVEKSISNVEIISNPTKLTTEQYGSFNISGLELQATYYDGSIKTITGFYVTGQDTSKMGKVTLHFHYESYKFDIEFEVLEQQGTVRIKDGKIEFYRDYSQYEAYSDVWTQDSAIDSISGLFTITPAGSGLGVGKKNVQSYGGGNITYRVEVPDGNVIDNLTIDMVGRIYHSMSWSKCSAGTCTCCFQVLVSVDGGCNYQTALDYDMSKGSGSYDQNYNIDLKDYIGNSKCVLIRLHFENQYWDGILIQSLRFNGTYKEGQSIPVAEKGSVIIGSGKIVYERDFTSLAQHDMSWKNDKAVYATDGDLTISPSGQRCLCPGKQNVSSKGAGSVSYLVDLPEGQIFDKLNFTAHGRIYHSSSSATCAAGTCDCAFKILISVDGGYIYKEVYKEVLNHKDSNFNKTVSVDLDSDVLNRKSCIIKMYLASQYWNWVGITDLAINGTYKEGKAVEDVIIEDRIDQVYNTMGTGSKEWIPYTYSYKDVCIGSGDKAWLSIDGSDGKFAEKTGEIVYKLDSTTGSFAQVSITGAARVFSYQGSPAMFKAYYSTDGETYKLLKEFASTTDGAQISDINFSLGEEVRGHSSVYVKFEFVSGFWDWVCIRELHFQGYSISTYINLNLKDNNGNEIYSTNKFVKYETLNLEDYAKPGYVIDGVYSDQACTNEVKNLKLTDENNDLYIKYKVQEYTVSFEYCSLDPIKYNKDSELTLPTPTVEDYQYFDGWYLNREFTGEPITKIEVGTTGDMVLYAKIIENPELTQYKQDARNEVEYYVNKDDYRAAEQVILESLITNAKNDINACINKTNIDSIVTKVKADIDLLTTDEEYKLATTKEMAINSLEKYVDVSKYSSSDRIQILTIISNGKKSINAASSTTEVMNILNSAKSEINQYHTEEENKLITAKDNAIIQVNAIHDSLMDKNYSKENKDKLITLKTNALLDINSCTSEEEINIVINSYKTETAKIPEGKSGSGCGGDIIFAPVALIISVGISLISIRKKKEK